MKCERCPALTNVGKYEYPEYSCCLIDDDEIIDFKDGSCGCRRTSFKRLEMDIKKQQEIEAKHWEEYAKSL